MTSPLLRAQLQNAVSYDDPSEETLFEILGDIEAGESQSVMVERLAAPNGHTYAMAMRNEDGSYVVERRLGTKASHESTRVPTLKDAHELLSRWAFTL